MSDVSQIEYCASAVFAFVFYDWIINLYQEIRCFWGFRRGRKLTATTLLYGLSRYSVIIGEFIQVQSILSRSDAACQVNVHFQTVVLIVYGIIPAVFSTLRVYALSPNDKLVPVLTSLLLSVPVVVVAVFLGPVKIRPQTRVSDCSIYVTENLISDQAAMSLLIAGKICAVVGGLIVLFVTWHKAYESYLSAHSEGFGKPSSLVAVVFHNGSTYFLIITAMNFVSLIITDGLLEGFVFYATPPVTAVLTSRFLFNLIQTDRMAVRPSSPSPNQSPRAEMARSRSGESHGTQVPAFIAAMGATVPGTGLHITDSTGLDEEFEDSEDDGAHAKEGPLRAGEGDLLLGGENEADGENARELEHEHV